MTFVATYSFEEARRLVIDRVSAGRSRPPVEFVPLDSALGRVLASDICADRDYPPTDRSVRDGFAIRSADVPGELVITGEAAAGSGASLRLQPRQAIEIMTGAVIPEGADAVVMVEHVTVTGDRVVVDRPAQTGDFINRRGSEARQGEAVLRAGTRINFAGIAMLASVGTVQVPVFRKPTVAIIATGDEIVPVHETPLPHQIRNSNACSLAAQIRLAGGEPEILPVAPDSAEATFQLIEQGLTSDLLLLSGGVSAGKYDLVEPSLTRAGAEFYFDRVLIQPGQPLVFGCARSRFFFGLPGNPASTMVCFAIFARAALELLAGLDSPPLPLLEAPLATAFRHRPGLTRFLPAQVSPDGASVTPVKWTGSADIASLARSNAFLVAEPDKPEYLAGERIRVLLR